MGRSSSPIDIHHTHNHSDTMTRSTSPLHFLNPAAVAHLTHCHHHHHSSPSRASSSAAAAQADISRLLDPAYLPSSSSRGAHGAPSTAATAYVYVDPHGDMHDPDYRHFPVSQHHHTNLHLNNHSPNGKRRGTSPRRPHFDWEMEIDEQALEEEYYEEEGSFAKHSAGPHYHSNHHLPNHNYNYTAPRYPTTASSSRTWSSSGQSGQSSSATRPRDSSFSTTVSVPMSKYSPTYSPTYYSPTGTASTLPTSYEDDAELSVEGSPFEEKEKQEKEKERKKLRRSSRGDKEKERLRAAEKEREKEREEEAKREKEAEEQREREREREDREREERRASFEYTNYIDLTPSPRRTSRTYGRSRHRRSLDLYAADDEERRSTLYPSEDREDEEEDDSARLHTGLTSLHPPSLRLGLGAGGKAGGGGNGEYVPTCTQSLRRQWQALSLSFRFSLFRAQRRVMRRVASLTT
ncbi:hypothetical protein CVT26_000465 [Gymnopilus dilepis]|uniref:Uncharacterized protein n=1 Tax=Gymnopilus dilepis TaxID=231916 RepID=A0A409Y2F8_9AGAR|nr:hypothetical protein CVT26_000465 [Gymnopilus dilepis]